MTAKSEEWPLEWTDDMPESTWPDAMAEFRSDVIAYAQEHGRAAALDEFPNTDEVEAIFAELDAQS